MCLSQTIHHEHVSITAAITFRITFKKIRNPNKMSKCISEPLDITKKVTDPLYSAESQLIH